MDLITIWQYAVVFIFGTMLGSFLNVLIIRINEETPWWSGRSRCPVCKSELKWFELVPLISFLIQKGECRNCKTPISWQYPLIEFISGFAAIACLYYFGFTIEAFVIYVLVYLMLGSFTSDLKFMEIPELFTYGSIVVAIVYAIFWNGDWKAILIGGIVGLAFFAVQYFATKGQGIGLADLKLGLAMGIFLGWPMILVMILSAYVVASLILVPVLLLGKLNLKSAVPLGVFLIPVFVLFVFFNNEILLFANLYLPFTILSSL